MSRAPVGIVLAAGHGRRMGVPKARLVIGGRSLLDEHAARLAAIGCARIALVVRPEIAAAIGDAGRPAHAFLVPVRSETQAGSLAAGLAALGPIDSAIVVITPVDLLPPAPETFRALLDALEVLGEGAATPTCGGRGGHPVVARGSVLARYLAGDRTPLRDVLRGLGARRQRIEVADPRIVGDFDTPTDLAGLVPPARVPAGAG